MFQVLFLLRLHFQLLFCVCSCFVRPTPQDAMNAIVSCDVGFLSFLVTEHRRLGSYKLFFFYTVWLKGGA